jgi:hypothetical protein
MYTSKYGIKVVDFVRQWFRFEYLKIWNYLAVVANKRMKRHI